jgi:F-type H+-transporting ATPase subunit delta
MKATKIANRYANAYLQHAISEGVLEKVFEEMKWIADQIRKDRDLRAFLKSPVIRPEKKVKVLSRLWGEQLSELTMQLVHQACRKDREMYLLPIAKRFVELYKEHKNILTAQVRTAVPLDENLREAITQKVRKEEGQEVDLQEYVDPGLIGGVLLKVGDRQYDASVLKQLRKLRANYRSS